MKSKLLLSLLFFLNCYLIIGQTTYTENFDSKGYPKNLPNGAYWKFYNDIYPAQTIWDSFIPGDGNAYITVDADKSNDTDETYPYQTLVFGGIAENHKLEVRMKGAAVDGGLAAFIFTYTQTGSIFNEVDIEIVAQDLQSGIPAHDILPPNGWTDARFNTWRNANENTYEPFTGSSKPIVDENNNKVSLIDGEFHTYTIDWREDQVDFIIDGVLQESFTTTIATGWSEVIIGYRNLPWAGDFRWTGNHTMVIDYFKIEPLEPILSTDFVNSNLEAQISIYPNPVKNEINIKIADDSTIKKMELINVISSRIIEIKDFKNKIDISSFSKGVYFLKTAFKNGNSITKKILKL
jgi:beta-glucanase (GH16 family)